MTELYSGKLEIDDSVVAAIAKKEPEQYALNPEVFGNFQVAGGTSGGMNKIYFLCEGVFPGERLAARTKVLKVEPRDRTPDPVFNLKREISFHLPLAHPNIPKAGPYGQGWFVQEHRGAEIYTRPSLSCSQVYYSRLELASQLVREMSRTIGYLKQQGIIHNDIGPANVLIDARKRLSLTDLGVAFNIGEYPDLGEDAVFGNVFYMSPERVPGSGLGPVGVESEVFALGVMAYELLSGAHPWREVESQFKKLVGAKTPAEANGVICQVIRIMTMLRPIRLKEIAPQVTDRVDKVVMKMLAKHPADRLKLEELVYGLPLG